MTYFLKANLQIVSVDSFLPPAKRKDCVVDENEMRKRVNERFLYRFLLLLYAFTMTCLVFFVGPRFIGSETGGESGEKELKSHEGTLSQKVNSNKGAVTLREVNTRVFREFGYEIARLTVPIVSLRMLAEPSCNKTFADWLKTSRKPQPEAAPREIPDGAGMGFLLNNYTALEYVFSDDKNSTYSTELDGNWVRLAELIFWTPEQLANLEEGSEGVSLHNAMKHYRLDGMRGLIIGSIQPWVEVYALQNGAAHVLTVHAHPPKIQEGFKDRIASIDPAELAATWLNHTLDFAASFSMIGHAGLGRFGDPIDMIGDLREVRKIRCLLKPGGLLFLGAHVGVDMIVFNLHRVYGPIRMAMMIQGFELIAAFRESNPEPVDLNDSSHLFSANKQITLVLRKL